MDDILCGNVSCRVPCDLGVLILIPDLWIPNEVDIPTLIVLPFGRYRQVPTLVDFSRVSPVCPLKC